MKSLVLFFGALLLSANAQEATVGLNAELLYNENAPDKQGPAVVIDVIDGTPAAKAGIRNGDLIVGLNGADVAGKTAMESLHASLVGPPGGQIKLTIFRVSEGRHFEAALTRVTYPLRRNPSTDPFEFSFPANWRPEVDAFPLPWSTQLPYHGCEDLVFASGFDDKSAPAYHSYAFVWWLEGKQEFSAERLDADLLTYYKGISEQRGRTRNFKPDPGRVTVAFSLDRQPNGPMRVFHGDAVFYAPTGQLLTLHGQASFQFCGDHTAGVFILSPQPFEAPIWKDLEAIRSSFRCESH